MTNDQPKKVFQTREHRIRLIHVAKRELALTDDDYRNILSTLTGKDSCSKMTDGELDEVLAHLKRLGFKVKSRRPQSRPLADDRQSKMIRGLWLELYADGAIRDPSERALARYVKRITRIDALQWIDADQASTVIEGLKKWRDRHAKTRQSLTV